MIALRVAAMALGLIVCVPFHYLWRLFAGRSPWPRLFLAWAGRCAGLRVRVVGHPLRRNVLFVSNHVTWLDILAIGGTTAAVFVSRDDVSGWPVAGWLARLNDTLFVARHDRRAAAVQAEALRAMLASGRPVALFPEGTTEGGDIVLPFRPSLFASVFPSLPKLTVQPIAIDYGPLAREIAWVGSEPAGANAKRVLARRAPIPVTLRFLDPVDPHEAGDRKALAARARDEIVSALGASEGAPHPLYARR
jgi:lyso-ornithine lipid O-acyltransferase